MSVELLADSYVVRRIKRKYCNLRLLSGLLLVPSLLLCNAVGTRIHQNSVLFTCTSAFMCRFLFHQLPIRATKKTEFEIFSYTEINVSSDLKVMIYAPKVLEMNFQQLRTRHSKLC